MSVQRSGRLRSTSPRAVMLCGAKMTEPGHVCAFFDSRQQKYDALAPYFRDAIVAGERIINVVDASERAAHVATLEAAQVPVGDAVNRQQMSLLTTEETYLRDGAQDLSGMLDLLEEALSTAEREGRCVRTCGEMSWIARSTIPIREVLAYEAKVNRFVPTYDCTLVCVYDVAAIPSSLTSDILATHPYAIVNNRLRPNEHFIPPDDYLRMLSARSIAGA